MNAFKGKFHNVVTDENNNMIISFVVSGQDITPARDTVKKIKDYKNNGKEILKIECDIARAKRSLDANAYAWVLIDKIAKTLSIDKAEVYKAAIKDIGGVSEIICVKEQASERLCSAWNAKGIGWQSETVSSKIDGCTNVILYYGSSVYDTKQMSLLIEHLIYEAKSLGIEVLSPDEIAKMMNLLGKIS